MKTEIILRTYTKEYMPLMDVFKKTIEDNTDYKVILLNHCDLSLNDFEHNSYETLISIDAHIASRLKIPYYRISRVFNQNGDQITRYCAGSLLDKGSHIRILDSDIVNGGTAEFAKTFFETDKFSAPLQIQPHQDLIDIEDIVDMNSIILDSRYLGKDLNIYSIKSVEFSYLYSKEFFSKRTSLPETLWETFVNIRDEYFEHNWMENL